MVSKYFNDGGYYGDFKDFLEINAQKIAEFGKAFSKENMSLSSAKVTMDAIPLDHSGDPRWLSQYHPDATRLPDLVFVCPGMRVSDMPVGNFRSSGFIEIKDFPRMSWWPATGFPLYCLQSYIAAQHYYDCPVAVFFRDRSERADGTAEMPPFELIYGEEPYGGMICDLKIHSKSFIPENGKSLHRTQVRFLTQFGSKPMMQTVAQFASMLRKGSVRRVVLGDPYRWNLWETMQNRAEGFGIPKMTEPSGGLICYTSDPNFGK